jgi:hypothetical protein
MPFRRPTLKSAVAALGVGAAIVLSTSTPASAANEGDHWMQTPNCAADQEIALHYVNGAWHDEQELNPTVAAPGCDFVLTDNGTQIFESHGAGSGWIYDGPTHYICAKVDDTYNGIVVQGVCN